MSLKQWENNGWLRPHKTSPQEIKNLFEIVDRDIKVSAKKDVDSDWRFGIAYNAALKLCTILLYSSGYRPERNLAHYRTLQALPEILGSEHQKDADYLDACRKKRNIVEYEYTGAASQKDADELIDYVKELKEGVVKHLAKNKVFKS
jgi:hypothetical protein